MRVLITGGAGFIGSHAAERLAERRHQVLVVDNYATARRDTLASPPDGITVIDLDIGDAAVLARAADDFGPDVVLHCAASYKDPEDWTIDARTNVIGTINVVRAAQRVRVGRFIYFQTALCYGSYPKEQPVTLAAPLAPENSYAISKTAGEQYIALSGLEFISLRLANMYGPRNVTGPVPTFFSRLSKGQRCFAVTTRRDFVFVNDLMDVVVAATEGAGSPGCYHISSGRDYAISELYEAVAAAMGVDAPVEIRERGADDAPTILLDPSRAEKEFGWRVTTPLVEGVRRTVDWYRVHGVDQTYTHLRLDR
jgi:UDP-glucose 4-epimerase